MNDSSKYIRLLGMLFLSVLGFLAALLLVFLGIRLLFGFVNQLSWITYVYTLFVISVPAVIFITAFIVFFYRTRSHPSKTARIISYILFVFFLTAWVIFYVLDMFLFFKKGQIQVVDYHSWNMIFLAANVACLFIVGVIQALSFTKEEDWLQRNKRKDYL